MNLSFVETMRGWLRDEHGAELPVSFELVAEGGSRGVFDLRGVLALPPLARETAARGTLHIGTGVIAYRLEFAGSNGQPLRLEATKYPSLRSPRESMTRMRTTVCDQAGICVASGEMQFALPDLPEFLASWLPWGRRRGAVIAMRRRSLERRALYGDSPAGTSVRSAS